MSIRESRSLDSLQRIIAALSACVCFLLLCVSTWSAAQAASKQQDKSQDQIGYKSAGDAEQKKTLLLKDFQPVPMLHAPVHKVDRAKYYVIDVHNHVNDAARIEHHRPPARRGPRSGPR